MVQGVNFTSDNTKSDKRFLKISKFENDVMIRLHDPMNSYRYTVIHYKDFLLNKEYFVNMNFELNSKVIMNSKDINLHINELKNGEIVEFEMN